MKVFITGGCGFIGSYLSRELVERGHEVVLYDSYVNYVSPRQSHYYEYLLHRFEDIIPESVEIIQGDTRNKSKTRRAIIETEPDRVVHLAALPIADVSNEHSEEAMDSILQGTANVLEAVRDSESVDRFVYTSSSMIYGDFEYRPADEEHSKTPKGIYGGAKYAGETITRSFCRRFDIDYVCIRPSAVYGPTDANRRVTQIFVERALAGEPLKLHNGGSQKLDFTHVTDTAHGFTLATLEPEAANENFNITRGQGRSIKELGQIVKESVPDAELIEEPQDTYRPRRGALDIAKAQDVLGYEPEYDLEDGIEEYVDFVRQIGTVEGAD